MDNENKALGYEMVKSLGKYWARSSTKNPKEAGCDYFIELQKEWSDFYNNTGYLGKVYYKGEEQDINLNEWMFPHIFEGKTHLPGSYEETYIEFKCKTPQYVFYKISLNIGTTNVSLAELYMDVISIASLCKNTDELQTILTLYKATTYANKGEDYDKEIFHVEDIMYQAENDPSRKDFCSYCKQLILESRAKLK